MPGKRVDRSARYRKSGALPPIINEKNFGAIVAGLGIALHDHTLSARAKSRFEHFAIGVEARHIHAGVEARRAARRGKLLTSFEQAAEFASRVRSAAHGAEFHVAFSAAGFRTATCVANSESGKLIASPGQHRVSEILLVDGTNLPLEVQPIVNRGRKFAGSLQGRLFFCG